MYVDRVSGFRTLEKIRIKYKQMAFEILVALALIIIVLLWRIEHNELHKIINKLPGPPVLPILGNIQELSAVGAGKFKIINRHNNYYWLLHDLLKL